MSCGKLTTFGNAELANHREIHWPSFSLRHLPTAVFIKLLFWRTQKSLLKEFLISDGIIITFSLHIYLQHVPHEPFVTIKITINKITLSHDFWGLPTESGSGQLYNNRNCTNCWISVDKDHLEYTQTTG